MEEDGCWSSGVMETERFRRPAAGILYWLVHNALRNEMGSDFHERESRDAGPTVAASRLIPDGVVLLKFRTDRRRLSASDEPLPASLHKNKGYQSRLVGSLS